MRVTLHLMFSFLLFMSLGTSASWAQEKKFKRALVVGGLGIAPGAALGVIAGLKKKGWIPDVIITTCGASLSSAIYNSFKDDKLALEYAKSAEYQSVVRQATVETKNLLKIKKKFENNTDFTVIPQIFYTPILNIPEDVPASLPDNTFNQSATGPKLIMIAARAHFGPEKVGLPRTSLKSFTQVFFTDADTALAIEGFQSPIAKNFPMSFVESKTEVMTGISTEEAARASISDPFLTNPAKIGNDYYFTGAVDLFPLELAESLADEVVSNYPIELYEGIGDLAIGVTFGFSQSDMVYKKIQNKKVKWVDLVGIDKLTFDPKPNLLIFLKNGIPKSLENFQKGIQKQWDLGYERGMEAIEVQKAGSSTSHLRNLIKRGGKGGAGGKGGN
ncbi:MAG TPA: hypothetical protein VNJ01_03540 [Bacteriovoracaceae bacterium]|nr:hypothetical protein [Bacteriovoracaceae bacterium]